LDDLHHAFALQFFPCQFLRHGGFASVSRVAFFSEGSRKCCLSFISRKTHILAPEVSSSGAQRFDRRYYSRTLNLHVGFHHLSSLESCKDLQELAHIAT